MAEQFTSYVVDNDRRFRDAIKRAKKVTDDLRVPLTLIAKDFHTSEKAIFALKGPGQYPDLSLRYKKTKQKAVGFIYPILRRTGRLEGSLVDPTHPDSISEIINKDTLFLGTKVPYGIFHQSDRPRSKIPLRKFLFIGPEAPRFAKGDALKGRAQRWLQIMNRFVLKKLEQQGFEVGKI